MKTIKFKGKNTIFLNGIEYKGYNVGDLPNSISIGVLPVDKKFLYRIFLKIIIYWFKIFIIKIVYRCFR